MPLADKAETQQSITALVKLLLQYKGPVHKKELAEALGIPRASLSHSLSDPGPRQRPWGAAEVRALAIYYEISTDAFYPNTDARDQVLRELEELALDNINES